MIYSHSLASLAVLLAYTCAPVLLAADVQEKMFDPKGLSSIEIKNTTGDVTISKSKLGRIDIKATKEKFGKHCDLKIANTSNSVVVEVKQNGGGEECTVHIAAEVPESFKVDVMNGSGNLTLRDLTDEVEFKLGSGDVTVNAALKEVEGATGSGSITFTGSSGDLDLKTGSGGIKLTLEQSQKKVEHELKAGSGDIEITYKNAPESGELDVKTGSGDVTVSLPANTKFKSKLQTGSGDQLQEVASTPSASFEVSLRAGSGDVAIKKI